MAGFSSFAQYVANEAARPQVTAFPGGFCSAAVNLELNHE
jgi:hypothetical protein